MSISVTFQNRYAIRGGVQNWVKSKIASCA